MFILWEGVKNIRLYRGHEPYQGGEAEVEPVSAFFRQSVTNIQHALAIFFCLNYFLHSKCLGHR